MGLLLTLFPEPLRSTAFSQQRVTTVTMLTGQERSLSSSSVTVSSSDQGPSRLGGNLTIPSSSGHLSETWVRYRSRGADPLLKQSTHSTTPLPIENNPLHILRPSCLRRCPLAPPVPELSQPPGVSGSSALSPIRSRGIPCLRLPSQPLLAVSYPLPSPPCAPLYQLPSPGRRPCPSLSPDFSSRLSPSTPALCCMAVGKLGREKALTCWGRKQRLVFLQGTKGFISAP